MLPVRRLRIAEGPGCFSLMGQRIEEEVGSVRGWPALGIFIVSNHSFSAYFLFLLAQKKKQKKGAPSP